MALGIGHSENKIIMPSGLHEKRDWTWSARVQR